MKTKILNKVTEVCKQAQEAGYTSSVEESVMEALLDLLEEGKLEYHKGKYRYVNNDHVIWSEDNSLSINLINKNKMAETFEQLLDQTYGSIDSKERAMFEENAAEGVRNIKLLKEITDMCNKINIEVIKDSCTKKEYEAVKVLQQLKWIELESETNKTNEV